MRENFRTRREVLRRNSLLNIGFDLLLLLAFSSFVAFYALEEGSFHPRDETTHVRVTQEMEQTGDFWNPKVFGQNYYNKPPFKMWLSLIPVKIFGPTNFGYRFIDALAGVISTLALYLFGRIVFQSRAIGLIAAVSLITSRAFVFHHGIRTATQDSLVNLFNLVSMFIAWRLCNILRRESAETGNNRKKAIIYALVGGVTIGFAAMTKNVAGFIPLGLTGIFLLASGEIKGVWQRGKLPIALVVGLGFLIPALYVVPHCLQDYGFCKVMLGDEVVDRATVGYHNRGNILFYAKRLLLRAGPPPELFIPGVLLALGFWFFRRDRKSLFVLIWGVVPVVVFSLIPSRLQWYMAPAFPGLAVLAGISFKVAKDQATKRIGNWWRGTSPMSLPLVGFAGFFLFSISGVLSSVYGVVNRVQVQDDNLELDLISREIIAKPELSRHKIGFVGEATLSRPERIYLHRIPNKEDFKSLSDLSTAISSNQVDYALASAVEFNTLARIRKVSSYKFLKPEYHRNTWNVLISYEPVLLTLEKTYQILDLQEKEPLLYGWSSPQLLGAIPVKQLKESEAGVKVSTNLAYEVLPTKIKITAGVLEKEPSKEGSLKIFVNSQEVGEVKVGGARIRDYSIDVPAGVFKSGQSVIVLKTATPGGINVGIKEITVSLVTGIQ